MLCCPCQSAIRRYFRFSVETRGKKQPSLAIDPVASEALYTLMAKSLNIRNNE